MAELQEKKVTITQEKFDEFQKELDYLKIEKRTEIEQAIKEAKEQGDLSENSEYDAARDEQAKVENRIRELEYTLKNCEILDEKELSYDKVSIGVKVKIKDKKSGKEMSFDIVGTTEADISKGKISDESPLGKALMGKKVGEEVSVDAPRGEIKYTVLEISKRG